MRSNLVILVLAAATAVACGGDTNAIVDPSVDDFVVSEEERQELDEAAANGEGAEGSYDHDQASGTLTITITTSSFDCGPKVGSIVATVESVTATELILQFEGDSSSVFWTRVDDLGQELVGIWRTTDPDIFLILAPDNSAQIFGEQEVCNEDRPRNSDNCLLAEASNETITIDGALSDWDAVGSESTVDDPAGDHQSDDPGADLLGTKVAFDGSRVSILTQLAAAPSEEFQNSSQPNDGSYRLLLQGYNGLSVEATLFYSPESQSWELSSFAQGVEAEAGPDGIEWSVDISSYLGEGFESVDFIMVEPRGCGVEDCGALDAAECVYFDL